MLARPHLTLPLAALLTLGLGSCSTAGRRAPASASSATQAAGTQWSLDEYDAHAQQTEVDRWWEREGQDELAASASEDPERNPAAVDGESLVLVGQVPNRYLGRGGTAASLAKVVIQRGIITAVEPVGAGPVDGGGLPVIELKTGAKHDVIYPGMINLHNHSAYNSMPVWGEARGQFENRFEWRTYRPYKQAVSGNMNPWKGYGGAMDCAAFRWAELQSLALGTVYLNQADATCVENFAGHRVEDPAAYRVDRPRKPAAGVRAPTDTITPDDFDFVWNFVRPAAQALGPRGNYESGLLSVIHAACPALRAKVKEVSSPAALSILSNKAALEAACPTPPEGFIRYVYFQHPSIAGKQRFVASPFPSTRGAYISHLSEGRQKDPYNQLEWEIFKFLGLARPGVTIVHGVGLGARGFAEMAKSGVSLVWSPFSNLLLYGETVDIPAAMRAGVMISLGTDWTPTGSKGLLEELKIAKQISRGTLNDEQLYAMVTENPAAMIGHLENARGDGVHGVGAVVPDAMGTLVVMSARSANVFTNLVDGTERDVNLVVVDGRPVYGNESYLQQYAAAKGVPFAQMGAEALSSHPARISTLRPGVVPGAVKASGAAAAGHVVALGQSLNRMRSWGETDGCRFAEPKLFVPSPSGNPVVTQYAGASGLNLDRYSDIARLVGAALMTQGMNANGLPDSNPKAAIPYFPPLLSCNDPAYLARFTTFVAREVPANRTARAQIRAAGNLDPEFGKKMVGKFGIH